MWDLSFVVFQVSKVRPKQDQVQVAQDRVWQQNHIDFWPFLTYVCFKESVILGHNNLAVEPSVPVDWISYWEPNPSKVTESACSRSGKHAVNPMTLPNNSFRWDRLRLHMSVSKTFPQCLAKLTVAWRNFEAMKKVRSSRSPEQIKTSLYGCSLQRTAIKISKNGFRMDMSDEVQLETEVQQNEKKSRGNLLFEKVHIKAMQWIWSHFLLFTRSLAQDWNVALETTDMRAHEARLHHSGKRKDSKGSAPRVLKESILLPVL